MSGAMDLGVLEAKIVADIRNFQQNMTTAGNTMDKFEKKSSVSLMATAQRFRTFGYLATTALTVPLVMAGKAMIEAAKGYEFNIQKIVGLTGVGQQAADEWSKAILKLGPDVAKGPQELADAMYFISSAAFRGKAGMDVLTLSAKAASAGLGETKDISMFLTSALNAYAGTGLDAAKATDILIAAVRESKVEATSFTSSIGQIIPIAAELGVSLDQVAGGMSVITLTGSTASQAATYLKGVFNSLLKSSAHGEKALVSMGSSYSELRNILRNQGLIALLQKVRDLSVDYGETLASEVFPNIRALTAYLSIAGKNFEYNKTAMDRVANSTGSLDKAWNAVADTIQIKWNKATSQIQVSLISLGQILASRIIPILEGFAHTLSGFTKWFGSLGEGWKKFISGFALLLTVIGPLSMIVSLLLYSFKGLQVIWALTGGALFGLTKAFAAARLGVYAFAEALTALSLTNEIGLIIMAGAAILALTVAIVKAVSAKKELSAVDSLSQAANQKFNENLTEEKTTLQILTDSLTNNNVPLEIRKELIDEFNSKYSQYLGYMINENTSIKDIKEASDALNISIEKRLMLEAAMGLGKDYATEKAKKAEELKKAWKELSSVEGKMATKNIDSERGKEEIQTWRAEVNRLSDEVLHLNAAIKDITNQITTGEYNNDVFEAEAQKVTALNDELKRTADTFEYYAKKESQANEDAQALIASNKENLGLIAALNEEMKASKDSEEKAKTVQDINKAYLEQLRIQRDLNNLDPRVRHEVALANNKRKQSLQESATKALIYNAEEEDRKLFEIKLAGINNEIALEKGDIEKTKDLQMEKAALISDYTVKARKTAADKVFKQLEVNASMERLMAERNIELTVRDEKERAKQMEDIALDEAQKKLDLDKAKNIFARKPVDPALAEEQKKIDEARRKNSYEYITTIEAKKRAEADYNDTQKGAMDEIQKRRTAGDISEKQKIEQQRTAYVDYYNFLQGTESANQAFIEGLSRSEISRTISNVEEKIAMLGKSEEDITNKAKLEADLRALYAEKREEAKLARIKDLNTVAAEAIKKLLVDSLVALGESLGNLMSGVEDPFKAMRGLIANFLIDIGKALISTAILSETFQALIWDNPIAAIAVGVAAIAMGTYLKNKLEKGPTPMANGGLLYGPTNVLAGEYSGARNNPEVIAPLNKLQGMLQPAYGNERLVTEVSGRNLKIILLREDNYQNRKG